ncbi:adhesion G-protein coupled receptor G6-like isoform X2 [Clytia hemisphaerica]|uniref:adhesion G-protein coupled receptor G6-like isoform X2 n=1 Tax=Clytia hemisphaerica TaxID=252671 RepID=UPI0034D5FA2A
MKTHNIFIAVMQIISLMPCASKRYYLLNLTDSRNSTNDFTVDCRSDIECGTLRKGGWRFENRGWIFDETDLKKFCCKLRSNPVGFPEEIPRPSELVLQLKVDFRKCSPYGSAQLCREYLRFVVNDATDEFKETIKPGTTGTVSRKRNITLFNTTSEAQIEFSAVNFVGVVQTAQLYFLYCKSSTRYLVNYPNMAVNTESKGRCVANAVPLTKDSVLKRTCLSIGEPVDNKEGCVCERGFKLVGNNNCSACDANSYKPLIGDEACQRCPNNSRSNTNRTFCDCNVGFQRYNESQANSPCFSMEPCLLSRLEAGSLGTYIFPQSPVGTTVKQDCTYGSVGESFVLSRTCVMNQYGRSVWSDFHINGNCRHAPCPAEVINNEKYGIYTFPQSRAGQSIRYSCKFGSRDQRNTTTRARSCILDKPSNKMYEWHVYWADIDLGGCRSYKELMADVEKVNITKTNVEEILKSFQSITTNTSYQDMVVSNATKLLKKSLSVAETEEAFDLILTVVDDLTSKVNITSSQSSSEMLTTLDLLADALIASPLSNQADSISFNGTNFGFGLKAIPQNYTHDLISRIVETNDVISVEFVERAESSRNDTLEEGIEIPKELFKSFNESANFLYSYIFKDGSLFVSNTSYHDNNNNKQNKMVSSTLDGHVLAVSVHNKTIKGLKQPVKYTTKVSKANENGVCAFWKIEENPAFNRWSTEGCNISRTFILNNSRYVTCQCDHMTSFGVLLNIYEESFKMVDSFALSLVSQIGCYVSIGSLLITLVALSFLKELRTKTANKILINLSLSMLCLLVSFLAGIQFKSSEDACPVIGVLLHMFVLTTFCWMCIEALSLYRKAVRTFKNRGEGKIFYRTSFVVGWGVPLLIALTTRFSGYFSIPPVDKRVHCMISGLAFKYTLLLPVSIILAINMILFIPVLRKVQGHITTRSSFKKIPKPKRLRRRVRVTISCSVLLGLTWVFAYLSIGGASYVFQWLFAIINSLQGFVILLFHVFLNDRVIKSWRTFFNVQSKHNKSSMSGSSVYRKDTSPIWMRSIKKAKVSLSTSVSG